MTQAEDIQRIKERLEGHPGPVLSVYLGVNARYDENQRQAYKTRLKDYLKENEVPDSLAGPVQEEVEGEFRPGARTLIFFAAKDGLFERFDVQVDLPEALHYGEPYLAPLVLALDEHEPYGVALVDAKRFRFFISAPMEEPAHASKGASSGFFKEIDVNPSVPYPRGGGGGKGVAEPAGRVRQANVHQYFNELGERTRKLAFQNNVRHLILAGPKERTSEFRETLPQDVQERVVAEEHVEAEAPENEVMEVFETIKERAEQERKAGLMEQMRESGVRGIKDTVEALQEGRVYHVLALWGLEAEIRWCDHDQLAVTEMASKECPYCGRETRIRELVDVVVDLAAARGARLEFVRSRNEVAGTPNEDVRRDGHEEEPADTLRNEFEGLAGLLRFTYDDPNEDPNAPEG